MKYLLISFLFLTFIFASCDKNRIFDDYKSMIDYKWKINEAVCFEFNVQDSSEYCNIYLKARNNQDYENKNLWMFVRVLSPDSEIEFECDLDCVLADDEGRWLGKGLGDIYDSSHLLKENFRFKHSGVYSFEITHGMRKGELSGIRDIGLRVEKRKEK